MEIVLFQMALLFVFTLVTVLFPFTMNLVSCQVFLVVKSCIVRKLVLSRCNFNIQQQIRNNYDYLHKFKIISSLSHQVTCR